MENVSVNITEIVEVVNIDVTEGLRGEKGEQGIQGEKGDAPTDEELNALIEVAIIPYITAMDEAIDVINGQII